MIKRHGLKISIAIIVIWITLAAIVWEAEAQQLTLGLVDGNPGHSAWMRHFIEDEGAQATQYTIIEQAIMDRAQVIAIPLWLDSQHSGACDDPHIPPHLNSLRRYSQFGRAYIPATNCSLLGQYATTVAAVDAHGNRPGYLPPVTSADVWIHACGWRGICSDSEATVRAAARAAK